MTGSQLRSMLESVLPEDLILEAVRATGFRRRHRKLDPIALVRALILSGGTPDGGRQADALRAYLEQGVPGVARGAFYAWFNERLGVLMAHLGQRALAYAASLPVHLPGMLSGRRDWRAVDSTVVKLPDELIVTFPGTGPYASLKVHKEYSLGGENVAAYHITPGRDHDGPELVIDESRRGTGLIVDLAYASHAMLRACRTHDVHVIVKLKQGWNVYLDETVSADEQARWIVGSAFEGQLKGGDIVFQKDRPFDVDVSVGPAADPIRVRLVGVPSERGYCTFLTTLPRETHPLDDVGTLYRLRWTIEIDNKLGKSACRLDQLQAQTPVSALILIHAAMIASIIANAIVRLDHIDRGAVGMRRVRLLTPPLHPIIVARMTARMADRIARTMADPTATAAEWDALASLIVRMGQDPNWRRRPSVLDRIKGRVGTPGRKRTARATKNIDVNA